MSENALRELQDLSNNPDILSVSQLLQNQPYLVQSVKSIATRYGQRLVAKIDEKTEVFLPARFGKASPQLVEQLNANKFCIVYEGEEQLQTGYKKHKVKCIPAPIQQQK